MADTHRMRTAEARGAALARKSVPALITGGAGDDPAGVMTYTVIGATTGFSQLWLLVLSTPMLVAATSMAARVALATNNGLAAVIRKRYGRPVSVTIVLLLAVANTATIAADVAGVAVVLGMVFQVRWEFFVPLILLALTLVLHTGYGRVKHVLTALTFVLLSYIVAVVMARPDWGVVVRATLVPQVSLNSAWLVAALGLLGTTISPYMLFWQANEDAEELHQSTTIQANQENATVWLGMIYSNLIAFFIIVAAATTIHRGGEQMQTLADAAQALSPLSVIGEAVFIVGVIGSGLLALPVLAGSTAYAVAEVFDWPEGLGSKAAQARGFYLVLLLSLGGGGLISLWPDFRPAHALFYSQVLDGVLLPVVMLILLVLSNDRQIMGQAHNPPWVNWIAGLTIVVAVAAMFIALIGT
jgi:NRAMP (natural resistance-associated macrophage protein)-like metal ion transporter